MIFIHVSLRTNYENYDFLATPYVNYVTRITNLERMEYKGSIRVHIDSIFTASRL
jgi:hypothetical protein